MQDIKPHLFVALYAGNTIGEARIIAASDNHELVEAAIAALAPAHGTATGIPSQHFSKSYHRALQLLSKWERGEG